MSEKKQLPLVEVTRRAIEILGRELGPVDTIRFLGQYTNGTGDYTTDRVARFEGKSVAELAAEVKAKVAKPDEPAA